MSAEVHTGENGWLFLTGGEHRVIDLFRAESAFTPEMANQWVELLRLRADQLSGRGVRYVHVTAPDKLTLLNRHYTDSLANLDGSPIRQLHARHEAELPNFLNVVPYLSQAIDKYPVFWKTDNHWTAWGCFMAYQLLCSHLGVPTNTDILNYPFTEKDAVLGLGHAAFNATGHSAEPETVRTYQLDRYSQRVYANQVVRFRENRQLDQLAERLVLSSPDQLSRVQQAQFQTLADGSGSHVIYENHSSAAIDKKIVLFGDAYSEYRSHLLTGMLAETVREVHFIWSRSIDHEYVRQVRPDIVISQTSEASMTQVPEDSGSVQSWAGNGMHALKTLMNDESFQTLDQHLPELPALKTLRTELLGKETYQLNPPVIVQHGCGGEHQELAMQTDTVSLVELEKARLYFSGDRCLMRSASGQTVLNYSVDDEREARLLNEDYKPLQGTSFLLAPSAGAHCYYHWMLDILPKLGLLERQGISLDSIDHFLVREITGDFQRETLARLGIDESRIVETVKRQFLLCDNLLHIDMNNGINLKMNRFVPLWLKQTFLSVPEEAERLRLYISRPEGVRRGILNEHEIRPLVEAAGFTVVAMEGMSIAEQAALLSRADALMAPHGGALTNMVFCKPGIPVIEILSRHVFPYYYGLSELCGHRYHAIMQDPEADFPRLVNYRIAQAHSDPALQWQTQNESFNVDIEAVKRMLERLPG